MSVEEDVKKQGVTGQSELYYNAVQAGRPVVIVTKAAWYKELAGIVGAFAWVSLIGLWTYALAMPGRTILEEWWYLATLLVVALICSALREQSPRINAEKER